MLCSINRYVIFIYSFLKAMGHRIETLLLVYLRNDWSDTKLIQNISLGTYQGLLLLQTRIDISNNSSISCRAHDTNIVRKIKVATVIKFDNLLCKGIYGKFQLHKISCNKKLKCFSSLNLNCKDIYFSAEFEARF